MKSPDRPAFPFALLRFWFFRILPVWSLIAFMIFIMQLAICGIVHDNENVKILLKFIDLLPSIVKAALGGESLQVGNVSALIAIGYNHPFVLSLYMLFAVGVPTGFLAGEVQKGTMELILSRSATRFHVYLCAAILTTVGMSALVFVMFAGTVVATRIYDFGEPVPLYPFFQTAVNGGLLAGAVGAISLLTAASFRRRITAVAVAVAYLVLNYFVAILVEWWPAMSFLKPLTIFHYVNGAKVFVHHLWPLGDMAVLVLILSAAAAAGAVIWKKRDLPL